MLSKLVRDLITCPLSGNVMAEPVMASDGYVYERVALGRWMQTNSRSPVTQEPLRDTMVPAALMALFIRMVGHQAMSEMCQTERKLTMPKEYIGYLIGKKGRTIQKIRARTGTSISIDQENEPCVLTFSGGNVEKAIAHAGEVIKNVSSKRVAEEN